MTAPATAAAGTDRSGALLRIENLGVSLPVEGEHSEVLRGISLDLGAGEAVGLVGESGSGKSMTARAVARILPPGAVSTGSIRFDGNDVAGLRGPALRQYRGEVAVIFQDPRAHINPVRSIGDFMTEVLRTNQGVRPAAATAKAAALLEEVGIADGARRLRQFPHELSGGMLQRVMIASALLTEPRLLLADEPTTALDVTTQAEVMAILDQLRRERDLALLFITHDLELAGAVCDRTAVMYAGRLVETQTSASLHDHPKHPYTAALVSARPRIEATADRLAAIPGRPLSAFEAPAGCAFAPRCRHVEDRCRQTEPELRPLGPALVRCLRAEQLDLSAEVAATVDDVPLVTEEDVAVPAPDPDRGAIGPTGGTGAVRDD